MSRLNDIVSACESPEQVKNILEAMGSGWTDFIAMHAKKNIPYWGEMFLIQLQENGNVVMN